MENAAIPTILTQARQQVELAPYTSLRIGGPARSLVEVTRLHDLAEAVTWLRAQRSPFYIIGGGTNLLIDDQGLDCLVLINRAADVLEAQDDCIRASTGHELAVVVEEAARRGLSGLEFATGIPGSFGGGVVGNAGAWGDALGDILVEAEVVDITGNRARLSVEDCAFAYRSSALQRNGAVLLSATLQLRPGDPTAIRERMAEITAARAARHPDHDTPTAGSYFRNVQPTSAAQRRTAAGFYLEQVGAKQLRFGGAGVFENHANIVVNRGNATARDVLALTREMHRRVLEQFEIELLPEVRYVRPDQHHGGPTDE